MQIGKFGGPDLNPTFWTKSDGPCSFSKPCCCHQAGRKVYCLQSNRTPKSLLLECFSLDSLTYFNTQHTGNSRICKSHKHNKRAKRSSYFQLGGRRKRSSITGIHKVLNSTKMIKTKIERNTTRGQKLTNLKQSNLNLGESIHPYFDHSN